MEEDIITAADETAKDEFGDAVAISGNFAIIGAPKNDDGGAESGSAYIFEYDGVNWVQRAKLTASDDAAGDTFGMSVAIDGSVAVVGAPLDDDKCPTDPDCDSGSAYVYRYNGTNWDDQKKLRASDHAAGDEFGTSVAIDGDVILVGSRFDDDGQNNAGSVYVYRFDGNNWTEETKLKPDDPKSNHGIGRSVSISGNAALVGAVNDQDGGLGAGAAYVFRFAAAAWSQEAKIKASDAAQFDNFGGAVSISGDLALIGSQGDDDGGAAYVFRFNGTSWGQQAKIVAADATADDQFGESVSLSGATGIAGARLRDDAGSSSGSAYIIGGLSDCNTNGWIDLCDVGDGTSKDCNGNGLPDECDLADGSSFDCQPNGIPDECEADLDSDTIPDDCDNCPDAANTTQGDSDGDGVGDACDGCPADPSKVLPGVCGCGSADQDSDGDGALDCLDNCPNDPDKLDPGTCGCGTADTDTDGDGDGVIDCLDNCPANANADQADGDGNGVGDVCDSGPAGQPSGSCGCGAGSVLLMPLMLTAMGWMRRRKVPRR